VASRAELAGIVAEGEGVDLVEDGTCFRVDLLVDEEKRVQRC